MMDTNINADLTGSLLLENPNTAMEMAYRGRKKKKRKPRSPALQAGAPREAQEYWSG